ncbi:MAG TPA: SDR family oxidoreductase [Acidimicrobiia bacterium]|nr:SDR family oxidoreductase [Acidimicrobiia bacterium]
MDMTAYFRAGLFEGRVVLVTGGGSGIGNVIARAFGQLGAHVVIASRSEERLRSAVAAMAAEGIDASFKVMNIREPDRVYEVVDEIVAERGAIHVAVNNAGGQFAAREAELTPNGWKAVIDLNLNGTFTCCSAVGRHMIDRGEGGKIINMSVSYAEGRGAPGIAHRTAAAAGVTSLTKTLALAWARHGIQVNAFGPQYLTEGATENYNPAIAGYIESITPAGRWGDDHEIAGPVVMLASPLGDYITGVTLPIDGGAFLGPGVDYPGTPVLP